MPCPECAAMSEALRASEAECKQLRSDCKWADTQRVQNLEWAKSAEALATSQAETIKGLKGALERIIPITQWPTKNSTLYDARSRLDFIREVCDRALSRTPAGEARPDSGSEDVS